MPDDLTKEEERRYKVLMTNLERAERVIENKKEELRIFEEARLKHENRLKEFCKLVGMS